MIVDIHAHLWDEPGQLGPGTARRLVVERGSEPWNRPAVSTDALAQATGVVERVILHGFASRLLGASIPAERVAKWVADDPIKRLGFAGVDPLADDWQDEIQRATDLGLVGLTMSPAAQGCPPGDARAMAVYEQAARRRLPIMVLPGVHLNPKAVMEHARPELFDEAARRFPELCVVFAQAGYPWIDATLTLLSKHRRFFTSLSGLIHRPGLLQQTLLTAHQLGVADRLLLGSEFPFALPAEAIAAVYAAGGWGWAQRLPVAPREALQQIVERDALACLGLPTAEKVR